MSPRTGRRAGDPGTRDAILAAARHSFGEHGFKSATIRRIATGAGVDPALVIHYFGSKADLFAAAIQLPGLPDQLVANLRSTDVDHLGETLLRTLLAVWEQPETLAAWLGLIRSAVSDDGAAAMLREFLSDAMLSQVVGVLDADDAEYRVALAASQVVGLGIARHVIRLEPLASATAEELVAAVAPTLQRYLTGDLP